MRRKRVAVTAKKPPDYVQITTLVAVLGGGYAGKDAYDDVAAQLQADAVQTARLESTLSGLSALQRDHEQRPHAGAVELNARVQARVQALEVELAALRSEARLDRRESVRP